MLGENGKIFIVAEVDFPEGMASTACASLMTKGLHLNGADVCLAVVSKSFNGLVDNNKTKDNYKGIPYRIFNNHDAPSGHFSWCSYRNIKDISCLVHERNKKGYKDVIILYDNNFFKYFSLLWVCRCYGISYIAWEVEKNRASKPGKSLRSYVTWITKTISEKLVCRQAEKMIVISSQLKSYFSARFDPSKIHIAPIMVDKKGDDNYLILDNFNVTRPLYDNLKKDYAVVVYSGSFGEKDGFSYILDAFVRYAKQNKKAFFVTTGKPSKHTDVDQIFEQVKDEEVRQRIHYCGCVPRNELSYINQRADVLLVCRSNSEFANHGFPWKLGEYLMTQKPIIATRVGDIERYFTDEELFFAEPENAASIHKQIETVLRNKSLAEGKAEKAYAKALQKFDYIKVTKDCLDFIKS